MKAKELTDLLDMDQAIALLKTTRPTFYRWLRSGRIKGMKVGRQWRFYRQDIDRFLQGEPPQIDLPASIQPLVDQLTKKLKDSGSKNLPGPPGTPVANAVQLMVLLAVHSRASDIHLAPLQAADPPAAVGTIRLRIDGMLHPVAEFDARLMPAIIEHWKSLASCDPRERAKPQDGRIMWNVEKQPLDMRVNFLPTVLGESLTARLLRHRGLPISLDRLDYARPDSERVRRALAANAGLVLSTGPTGTGKTTVLYAFLNHIARPEMKVMTIEDPVEYVIPGVVQVAVNPAAGRTFSTALRATLRSDPDLILVGEIRDADTMHICFQAALTGHLVLSSLHTEDAPGALVRMVSMGAPGFLVADATKLVVAQRLIRLVCRECAVATPPPAEQLARARELATAGGLNWETLPSDYRVGRGCAKCGQFGYRGRTVIAEVLEITPEISAAMRRGAGVDELRAIAIREGMTTMAADAVRRAASGQTTLDEALQNVAIISNPAM